MNQNTQHVKALYEDATDVYLRATGYYIHGCAPPEDFNLPLHILNLLNVKEGGNVLDAGCGMGMMLIEMSKIRPDIKFYGITISERQFEICNELKSSYQADNVTFVLGDFHQLTNYFENQSMDAVYFNESLLHTNNLSIVLNEVSKVLKSNGVLYAKDIYINSWKYKIPIIGGKNYKTIKAINKYYHYYPVLLSYMKSKLKKAGFEIIEFNLPPYVPVSHKLIDFERAFNYHVHDLIQKSNATHWRYFVAIKK